MLPRTAPAGAPAAEPAATEEDADAPPYGDDEHEASNPSPPRPASSAAQAVADQADPLAECVRAFGAAQKLRRAGQLLACRQELTRCAQPACPTLIADRCARWYREVNEALPAVVVAARDAAGRDTIRVEVVVDGKLVRRYLDGRAIELDPGMHVLRLEHPDAPAVRRMVVLTEGEGVRRVDVDFSRPEPSTSASPPTARTERSQPPRSEPPWPIVITGFALGGAGLAVGAITGIMALDERATIAAACPDGRCPDEQRDDYRRATTLARVSTLGFITAAGGTTVGVLTLLLASSSPSPEPTAARRWTVRPTVAAGSVGIAGTFP